MEFVFRQALRLGGRRQGADVAMVKLALQPQLLEMGALEPITARLATWPGKSDLANDLLDINKATTVSTTTSRCNTWRSTSTTARISSRSTT